MAQTVDDGNLLRLSAISATRPRVVGLTGGIACGKSTVATMCGQRGAHVIDCDALGWQVYADAASPVYAALVTTFGADIVDADRSINRKNLGAKVFGHPAEMKKLTDIVWPAIRELARLKIHVRFRVCHDV